MNTFIKYLCGSALLLGLWSCATDEPTTAETPKFEGNEAVVHINIYAATDVTRAGADGANTDYLPGSDDENLVRKLNFYFYDKAGEYVTSYENATYTPSQNTGDRYVEEIGTSRVVLTDLLGQNYPSYVVAVLNYNTANSTATEDPFKKSLSQIRNALRTSSPWSSREGKLTDFIMTSATHSGNNEDGYFFATPVTEENFALQPEDANQGQDWADNVAAKPVDIYVERLASKIEIQFPGFNLNKDGYYEVKLPDAYEIDGVETQLTVRLYGWGVNGTAKNMKYFKAVNDMPNAFSTTDGWNYDGTNRCYWAKTPGYGENNYSSSFDDVTNKTGNPATSDDDDCADNEPLKYISWRTVKDNTFGKGATTAYVLPHTEAGEKINLTGHEIHHSAITEVLIAGQIVDAQGKGMTLFQLSDSYYTKQGVLNYLLNAAGNHIWKEVEDKDGKKAFRTIEVSDVDVKYGYDGTFSVVLTDAAAAGTWYQDGSGTDKWESVNAVETEINSYLPDHQSYCYNDGMLYYNIPIRHLRPYTAGQEIKTGMFGVVRNHWYQVSVNAVKNLGHSVYRPDEHIIPPSDPTRYMIGSTVKILSWRLVKQTAEL